MTDRKISSLGKTNKALLREEFGFTNINQAKKAFGVDTADEAYEIMKETHNDIIDQEKIQKEKKLKEDKAKQLKEDKEALKRKVDVWNQPSNIGEFISWLKRFRGKNVVCDVVVDGERVKTFRIEVDTNFNSWWASTGRWLFLSNSVGGSILPEYNEPTLYFYEGQEFNTKQFKKITQTFKDADNGKCVFNPIRYWANLHYEESKSKSTKSRYNILLRDLKALEEKYPNGVCETNVDEICNKLQIDISIEKPLCDEKFIVCKSMKKALKHFRYLNTRLNHVEVIDRVINNVWQKETIDKSFNEYVIEESAVEVSREKLLELKKHFMEKGTYHTFNKDLTNISKIQTINGVYSLSNEMMECFNEFEQEAGLNNCKLDDIDDAELSSFVKWGTHYNGTIDFKNVKEYKVEDVYHIDMSKAYSKYKKCKFYEGFLGKITDFRLTKTIQGVGMYYIYDLVIPEKHFKYTYMNQFKKYNDILKIYQSHNIYTSFELKFLESKGCSFKILAGCWGVKPLDFDFSDDMIDGKNDEGNSYYALWTGKCDSHYLQKKTWINGDYNMCCMIAENTTAKIEHYENGEICVKYDKKHNYHLGHVTAFITAYQRLNVLEQLDAIDYNNVIRVCVDGIYLKHKVFNLKNAFREKNSITDKTFGNIAGECFISNIIEDMAIGKHIYKSCGTEVTDFKENIMSWVFGEERKSNAKELHIGAGGNGKTHKNLVDKGLVKLLYVSPSWKLARNKQNEYGCKSSVWARLITDDPEMISYVKKYANVLLFDEVSMMTEQQKEIIFHLYSDMKIIFCGDIGYQLGACEYDICLNCKKNVKNKYCFKCNSNNTQHIVPEKIKKIGFNEVIENNTNYRCKDSRLLELYKDLRMMIDYGRPVYEINDFVIDFFMTHKRIINKETLQKMYKVNDMILVGTNDVKNEYTNMFANIEKYYVIENDRVYSNGDIVVGAKPNTKCELRHAYTTHSIQGETAQHNLFIDAEKMFDPCMFYTAISRAKVLEQIFIVE